FFQAEDGIRAFHVTGVQTCALPIGGRRHRRGGGTSAWLEGITEKGSARRSRRSPFSSATGSVAGVGGSGALGADRRSRALGADRRSGALDTRLVRRGRRSRAGLIGRSRGGRAGLIGRSRGGRAGRVRRG